MTHILHRQLRGTLPLAVGGRGIRFVDDTGKKYLDASGGAAVSCLGHGHPDVVAAMHAQIDRLAYAHTRFFSTRARRGARRPPDRPRAGTASRTCIWSRAARRRSRPRSSSRASTSSRSDSRSGGTSSRAGRAITATRWARSRSAATHGAARQFAPLLIDVDARLAVLRISRPARRRIAPSGTARACVRELEDDDRASSAPDNVIAFVAETVVGATAGARAAGAGLFQAASASSATATASC